MSSPDEEKNFLPSPRRPSSIFRISLRRSPPALPRRRRKMPTVRLGGRRGWRTGGRFLVGFLRRIRLRWLAAQYGKAMKRLKAYYSSLVKDMIDGAASMEAVQARILMETYFAVPVMPISIATGNYLK